MEPRHLVHALKKTVEPFGIVASFFKDLRPKEKHLPSAPSGADQMMDMVIETIPDRKKSP